jgi:hypothetical protein
LSKVLANGPVTAKDIEKEARAACLLSEDQLIGQSKPFRSARQALGISSYQYRENLRISNRPKTTLGIRTGVLVTIS